MLSKDKMKINSLLKMDLVLAHYMWQAQSKNTISDNLRKDAQIRGSRSIFQAVSNRSDSGFD